MATGVAGSTFADELNRLANAGTYPVASTYLSETGAANKWAGTNGLAMIGALNYIADPTRPSSQNLMINAVCNEIAGTTGLSALEALRSINL